MRCTIAELWTFIGLTYYRSIVKFTKAGALESIDNKVKSSFMLGDKNESFQFDKVRNKVEFKECSVKNMSPVNDWLKGLW